MIIFNNWKKKKTWLLKLDYRSNVHVDDNLIKMLQNFRKVAKFGGGH